METSELMDGGEKKLFDAIKGFKILQLRIAKQTNGGGLIEIKGSIDAKAMTLVEEILDNT